MNKFEVWIIHPESDTYEKIGEGSTKEEAQAIIDSQSEDDGHTSYEIKEIK